MYKGILNETLFKKRKQKTAAEIESFLSHLNVSNHSEDKSKLSEGDSTEKDLQNCLKSMQKEKYPGNDGL